VVSHGRHHHNRLSLVSAPSFNGLNAPAGSPQNRHSDPPPAGPSIHPVVLAVAACIPSNLGVRFTLVLHDRLCAPTSRGYPRPADPTPLMLRPGCHPVTSPLRVAGARVQQRGGFSHGWQRRCQHVLLPYPLLEVPGRMTPPGAHVIAPAVTTPATIEPQHTMTPTRTSMVWTMVGVGAALLLAILVFILQNGARVCPPPRAVPAGGRHAPAGRGAHVCRVAGRAAGPHRRGGASAPAPPGGTAPSPHRPASSLNRPARKDTSTPCGPRTSHHGRLLDHNSRELSWASLPGSCSARSPGSSRRS
jgi:hypothetical protein